MSQDQSHTARRSPVVLRVRHASGQAAATPAAAPHVEAVRESTTQEPTVVSVEPCGDGPESLVRWSTAGKIAAGAVLAAAIGAGWQLADPAPARQLQDVSLRQLRAPAASAPSAEAPFAEPVVMDAAGGPATAPAVVQASGSAATPYGIAQAGYRPTTPEDSWTADASTDVPVARALSPKPRLPQARISSVEAAHAN